MVPQCGTAGLQEPTVFWRVPPVAAHTLVLSLCRTDRERWHRPVPQFWSDMFQAFLGKEKMFESWADWLFQVQDMAWVVHRVSNRYNQILKRGLLLPWIAFKINLKLSNQVYKKENYYHRVTVVLYLFRSRFVIARCWIARAMPTSKKRIKGIWNWM